jgi:hypothetical protein
MKLAPLMTPEEALRLIGIPRLIRSTNASILLSPSEVPVPRLIRSTNTLTPTPRSPIEVPPQLTREDERRRVTAEEIESIAKKLW